MQTRSIPETKRQGIFFYLFLLTCFFLILEINFFLVSNQAYLYEYTYVSHHIRIPVTILPSIIFYIGAQLSVHLLYCFGIWWITDKLGDLFPEISPLRYFLLSISLWIFGIITILIANFVLFPNSKFSGLLLIVLSDHVAHPLLLICLAVWGIIFGLTLISLFMHKHHRSARLIPLLLFLLILFPYIKPTPKAHDAATAEKPNIIIIGIDSVRPDFLGYFGRDIATPFIDSFLSQASIFSDAITPLARTFPSWTSILTGQYPRQNGVRFNLAEQNLLKFQQSLPAILKQNGYLTVYATDETRFSNIDTNFGFDRIVTPPVGLNDFLLGSFNDFPLSNLLINSSIGHWLFPYSYANRAAYFVYEPDSFLHLIQPTLFRDRTKPLFLAIHFCLPHHPYIWGSLAERNYEGRERYKKSIERADRQVQDFFTLLNQAQLLNHTIVVLLSDHGEGLELPGDRVTEASLYVQKNERKFAKAPKFYPPSLDTEEINESVGHGTDVLGLTQYHTVLAFRSYGTYKLASGIVPGAVSLTDIKPTLLDMAGIQSSTESLTPLIRTQGQQVTKKHHIFLESDYAPRAIMTVYPETSNVLHEGIQLFKVDPQSTRLIVQDKMAEMIIHSKQIADIYDGWILALYPQNNHYRMPILVNLTNGAWTNDLHSSLAQKAPVKEMLAAIKQMYQNEI